MTDEPPQVPPLQVPPSGDLPPTFPFAGTPSQLIVTIAVFLVMLGVAVLDLPWYQDLLAFGLLALFFVTLQVGLRRRWRARKSSK